MPNNSQTNNKQYIPPMKASSYLVIILVGFIYACSSITSAPLSQVGSHPTQNLSEVPDDGYAYIADSVIQIRSLFTDDSIRIQAKTSHPVAIRSILTNGVSIWVDHKGKRNEDYGISFPAARSEMLRKQEEIMEQLQQKGDTVKSIPFNPQKWVQLVNERDAVIIDKQGTQFADTNIARLWMDDIRRTLHYDIRLSLTQMGIDREKSAQVSVGFSSEVHQAQLLSGQGGGMAVSGDNFGRSRRQTEQQLERARLIPVKGWILFLLDDDSAADAPAETQKQRNDNYYPY